MGKKGLLFGEVIVIVLIVGILAAILLPALAKRRETEKRAACANNLKQLGQAISLYADENKRRYPPIDETKNNFIFDANLLYPEYLTDPTVVMCPANPQVDPEATFRLTANHSIDGTPKVQVHPDCFTDDSYVYLGWMVFNDKEAEALFGAYDKLSPVDYDTNITVPVGRGTVEGDTLYRLSAYVDMFLFDFTEPFITWGHEEAVSIVPVMWERPYIDTAKFSHRPVGGNVLFLDGRVEYILLSSKSPYIGDHGSYTYSPMTEEMARLLDERPRERIRDCE